MHSRIIQAGFVTWFMLVAAAWSLAGAPANVRIWEKPIAEGMRVVVERAYVRAIERPREVPHYQFSFLLEQEKPTPSRSLLWVRDGWETGLSAPLPQPEIDVLDATVTAQKELVVLFNQYGRCWAFVAKPQAGGGWHVLPSEAFMSDRIPPAGGGGLGPALRDGTVSLNDKGEPIIDGQSSDLTRRRFRLARTGDTWTWLAEPAPATAVSKAWDSSVAPAADTFTDDDQIILLSRESQAVPMGAGTSEPSLSLAEVIEVLTTYRRVSEEQYSRYHHTGREVRGCVTLAGGRSYLWAIEPGYAAKVIGQADTVVYLLRPDLKVDTDGLQKAEPGTLERAMREAREREQRK